MLNFGNKEFRNLQEQVQKNADDILKFNYGGAVLSEFGIRVVGQIDDADSLPDPDLFTEDDVGNAYAVGEEPPYELYILTRPFIEGDPLQWFNIGRFPEPGPQGEQGPQGATGSQGNRGTGVYTGVGAPVSISGHIIGDIYIDSSLDGLNDLYKFNGTIWTVIGRLRGATGLQGPEGPRGPQGPQGETGDQGPQGQPGESFTIIGQVASEDDLPLPSSVPNGSAFLVGPAAPFHLYVLILQPTRKWFDTGGFNDVEIISLTGSSGTLSSTDYNTLISSPAAMIKSDNEDIYRLNNETTTSMVYNMVDRYNVQKPTEKYIVVTKQTRAWQRYTEALLVASDLEDLVSQTELTTALADKQDKLYASGASQNIKTINNQSLLGSGNIEVVTDLSDYATISQLNTGLQAKQNTLVSGTNIKTINSASILGDGNLLIDTTSAVWGNVSGTLSNQTDLKNALDSKQASLVSGTNIKTINNESLLGSGNLTVVTDISGKQDTLVSGTNIKTINNESILGSGNININSAIWGNISGTLSNQADLVAALANFVDVTKTNTLDTNGKIASDNGYLQFHNSGIQAQKGLKIAGIRCENNQPTLSALDMKQSSMSSAYHTTRINIFANPASSFTGSSATNVTLDIKNANPNNIAAGTYTLYLPIKNGTLATLDDITGGTGTITDVTVGGTSVVSNGVAVIPALFSGNYNDLTNKPTIPVVPTNISSFTNDSGYITSAALSGYATESYVDTAIQGLGNVFNIKGSVANEASLPSSGNVIGDVYYVASEQAGYVWIEIDNVPQWEELGPSIDLSNYALKSELPTATSDLTNDSGFITSSALNGYALSTDIPTNNNQLTNGAGYITSSALSGYALSSSLAAVATSGSYNDLSNKPVIPSEVTPNPIIPSGLTPTTLTGLQIGNGYYSISAGGAGGSTVTGTNDGTNWTTITIDGTTKAIPQGGSGSVTIDEKTIVEGNDGLETATGAWKEEIPGTPGGSPISGTTASSTNPPASGSYILLLFNTPVAISHDDIAFNINDFGASAIVNDGKDTEYGAVWDDYDWSGSEQWNTEFENAGLDTKDIYDNFIHGDIENGAAYLNVIFDGNGENIIAIVIDNNKDFFTDQFSVTVSYTPSGTAAQTVYHPMDAEFVKISKRSGILGGLYIENHTLNCDAIGYQELMGMNYATQSDVQDALANFSPTNIVYSQTEPQDPVDGMIWLKPVSSN